MAENVIKKHQCPSCGGNLIVNSEMQMYSCSFCGSTYDYEYFREEEMYDLAGRYLSRGEYQAAADAYRFILDKDPHDFTARRGLMLSAGRIKNMDELLTEETKSNFSYDKEIVEEATEGASEDHKKYFEDLTVIFKNTQDLAEHTREMNDLCKEQEKIEGKIAAKEASAKEYYSKNGVSPEAERILMIIMMCGVTAMFGFFALMLKTIIFPICALLCDAFILFIIHKTITPRISIVDKIDKERGKLYVEEGNIIRRLRELDDESDKIKIQLDRTCPDFVQKDKGLISKTEDKEVDKT